MVSHSWPQLSPGMSTSILNNDQFVCALLDLCRFCCGHLLLNMSFQCLELQSCLCLKHVYENSGYSFFPNNTVYYTDILDQCNAVVAAVRQGMRVAFRIPVHIHTKHDNFSNAAQTTTLMKLTRFAFSLFESAVRVNYKWNSPMHVLCQLCGEDLIRILQRLDLLLTMLSGICKSCVLVHAFGLKLLTGQCVQVNRIFLCKSY